MLRVEAFGLTANNITYAVFGEAMSYWDFFPAADGWGRLPMWGFAVVENSLADGIETGARVYGFVPPSSHLVLSPGSVSGAGFMDAAPHRAALPATYNRYLVTDADAFYRPDTEAMQMLLRPLFFTAFLIGDQLDDEGLATRGPVVISSASSKTAIATAFLLGRRKGVEVVGLTSARSARFVEGLGIYDRVITYGDIDSLERRPATYVDIAGDAAVRLSIHRRFSEDLLHSMLVGVTHRDELTVGEEELPGPAPAIFFAPDRVAKRAADWGAVELETTVAEGWHPFCEWAGEWLQPIPGNGFEAIESAYRETLGGSVDPTRAHVLSLAQR